MSTATPQPTRAESLAQVLAPQRIQIPGPGEVQSYLQSHPDLTDLLVSICQQVRHEVGEQAELSLEVYHDPEFRDSYLTLYVRQDVYESDLLARIEKVSAAFEEQLEDRSGWLLVTTDFRPPRGNHGL